MLLKFSNITRVKLTQFFLQKKFFKIKKNSHGIIY